MNVKGCVCVQSNRRNSDKDSVGRNDKWLKHAAKELRASIDAEERMKVRKRKGEWPSVEMC